MKFGRTKTEILNHFSLIQSQLELSEERIAALEALAGDLLAPLKELYAVVRGESPSLLNEDSGGDATLDSKIESVIARAEAALNQKETA